MLEVPSLKSYPLNFPAQVGKSHATVSYKYLNFLNIRLSHGRVLDKKMRFFINVIVRHCSVVWQAFVAQNIFRYFVQSCAAGDKSISPFRTELTIKKAKQMGFGQDKD